jgi:hypothetical protein
VTTPDHYPPANNAAYANNSLTPPSLEEADAKLADAAAQVRDLITELVPGY